MTADTATYEPGTVGPDRAKWVRRVQEVRRLHGDMMNMYDAMFIKGLQRRLNEHGCLAVIGPAEVARVERIEREADCA